MVNFISKDLKENGVENIKIIGETKNRIDEINKFKNSDSIDVLIATDKTLSTGVTIVEANQMFFFGTPWRSADYNQCCDRIYRIGQNVDVYIYNVLLMTKGGNLSTKMNKILNWSEGMFNSFVVEENYISERSVEMLGNNLFDKCLEQVMREGFISKIKDHFSAKKSTKYNKNKELSEEETDALIKVANDMLPKATRILKKYGFTNRITDIEYSDIDEYFIAQLDVDEVVVDDDDEFNRNHSNYYKAFKEVEKLLPNGYKLDGDEEYDMTVKVDR